ncbi:MAG TPA: hypothetical protein VK897_19365 [Anaerolineales bacterium]|nr:hypothetical protein [Anaerolineales bacterium]
MPFILPTIPFTTSSTFVTGIISRQAATSAGSARLDASISSFIPGGGASTLTSLGANLGAAPDQTQLLFVSVNTRTFETGMAAAGIGTAQASATLLIFVEEFSPAGAFIRSVPGPPTVVYNAAAHFIGVDLRVNESNTRSASVSVPVVAGRIYVAWVDSIQSVLTGGSPVAEAVSNFTYDFGPMFFTFV